MKKRISIGMGSLLALALLAGCGKMASAPTEQPGTGPVNAKPVINFEGVVTEVADGKVTLKDGKVVLINEDTVFAGDPDMGTAVSEEILEGNFIQGYTEDDAEAEEITASKIWTNEGRTAGGKGGKRVINFEGRVAQVVNGRVTLDNGTVVHIGEDTSVTAPDGSAAEITEGDYIQGYAENVESSEIDASYILITTL